MEKTQTPVSKDEVVDVSAAMQRQLLTFQIVVKIAEAQHLSAHRQGCEGSLQHRREDGTQRRETVGGTQTRTAGQRVVFRSATMTTRTASRGMLIRE